MILGMSVATFTLLHVIISLIGILSDIVVVLGMLGAKRLPGWTTVFLSTTVLTSVTGFLFHSAAFGPPHVFGVISLVVLAPTLFALYVRDLAGAWRWIYIVGAVLALYLNAFVGVVQAFGKIGFLHQLAANGNELQFMIAQLLVLGLFVAIGIAALRRFRLPAGLPAFG
jgi:hypothetical protein